MQKKIKDVLISRNLDFLDTSSENVTEDEILSYLASIIADVYLKEMDLDNKEKADL